MWKRNHNIFLLVGTKKGLNARAAGQKCQASSRSCCDLNPDSDMIHLEGGEELNEVHMARVSFSSTHFCRCRHAANRKRPGEHKASMQRNQASTSSNKTSKVRKEENPWKMKIRIAGHGNKANANQIDWSPASTLIHLNI